MKRRNSISGQFSPRLAEMMWSPAYRVLSQSGHRVMSRIELELASHGGNDNGRLPVTKQDFIDYGIHHASIASAIREAEALGFIRVTERGRGGNSEHRRPNLFLLTFAHSRTSKGDPPSHDWRKIKTLEEAERIASAARNAKNALAVAAGLGRSKFRSRDRKPVPKPGPETGTEIIQFPGPETGPTGSGRKPVLLSISREGAQPSTGRSSPPPARPWSVPVLTEIIDDLAIPDFLRRVVQ